MATLPLPSSYPVINQPLDPHSCLEARLLLLELPTLRQRLRPNVSNVFRLHPRTRSPEDAWHYLTRAATHRSQSAKELFAEVRVSDVELRRPVLDP